MKRLGLVALCVFALGVLLVVSSGRGDAAPLRQGSVGTAITYQGRLLDEDNDPIQGTCAMTLTLWTAATEGEQIGSSQVFASVAMSSGFFLVEPDFGSVAWTGEARWLQIEAACNGGAAETFDRQAVHVVPYAVHSLDATATPQPTATLVATATPQPTATPLANVAFTNTANVFVHTQTINSNVYITGTLGVGTTNPSGLLHMLGTTSINSYLDVWNDASTTRAALAFFHRGASGGTSPDNARLGAVAFYGINSSAAVFIGAAIDSYISGTVGSENVPADLRFSTNNGMDYVERFRISPDGTVRPAALGYNLGTSSLYWNEVHYHTLVSHSLGDFSSGVLLRDGRTVSCTGALRLITASAVVMENGLKHVDYNSLPIAAVVSAKDDGQSGANLDAMTSLVMCAARELDAQSAALDARVHEIEKRLGIGQP